MSSLGFATLLGGVVGGVPMNATSAMTDLVKEGTKADTRTAWYTVPQMALRQMVWDRWCWAINGDTFVSWTTQWQLRWGKVLFKRYACRISSQHLWSYLEANIVSEKAANTNKMIYVSQFVCFNWQLTHFLCPVKTMQRNPTNRQLYNHCLLGAMSQLADPFSGPVCFSVKSSFLEKKWKNSWSLG